AGSFSRAALRHSSWKASIFSITMIPDDGILSQSFRRKQYRKCRTDFGHWLDWREHLRAHMTYSVLPMGERRKTWQQLAELAAHEKDRDKLRALIRELTEA